MEEGILEISRAHGLAGLRTNTVVLGWSDQLEGVEMQLRLLHRLRPYGRSILICRFNRPLPPRGKSVDIWWGGLYNNGDLMLLLAYLLQLNSSWEGGVIRILSVVTEREQQLRLFMGIRKLLPQARIQAKVEVLVSHEPFQQILHERSRNSDLVFLGLPEVGDKDVGPMARKLDAFSAGLRATVFVKNNSMPNVIPILLKMDH
jgi:hypothetical protein